MKKYRFAALFPAYGEDEVIIDSVKSFLQQDYPRELYDIIVIANQMRQAKVIIRKDYKNGEPTKYQNRGPQGSHPLH